MISRMDSNMCILNYTRGWHRERHVADHSKTNIADFYLCNVVSQGMVIPDISF